MNNAEIATNKFKELSDREQVEYLFEIKQRILKSFEMINDSNPLKKEIDGIFNILIHGGYTHINMTPELRANIIDYFTNYKTLSQSPEKIANVEKVLEAALSKSLADQISGNMCLLNEL